MPINHHENERDRPKIGAGVERVKGVANDRQHGSQGEGGRNPQLPAKRQIVSGCSTT